MDDWVEAFPLPEAQAAVSALCDAWNEIAQAPKLGFQPSLSEPKLTRALKAYVEQVTARDRGLLGMWATESVINTIDAATLELKDERRTDIVYGWNNDEIGIQLVFEFKKLTAQKASRARYLGVSGLQRFVTGIYAKQQAVAAMAAILMDDEALVVPPLRDALVEAKLAATLKIIPTAAGDHYERPSSLFPNYADFDTQHTRPEELAATHGTILVSHVFLKFGYPIPKKQNARSTAKTRPRAKAG
ncbi:MAG: hypothetical protein JNL81_12010 [Hyphomonadaceae bacterium]|nr:hypothetical protein [Hyphomonadaceae bacterium]